MTVNRERKMVQARVYYLDLEYNTLADARMEIDRLIAEYGETALLKTYHEAWDDTDRLGVFVDRAETDDEMAKRIAQEEYYAAQQAERDRREYDRLKALLG